jgi:hypothetical protein
MRRPEYAAIGARVVYLNETIGQDVQYSPGYAVVNSYYVEAAGADGAAHACWDGPAGSNCWNDSLDGLLEPSTLSPTSAWWAYWAYGQRTGRRPSSTTSDPAIVGSASADGSSGVVLVGYAGHATRDPAPRDVTLRLTGLGATSSAHVSVLHVPNTGYHALDEPVLVRDERVPVEGGEITLSFASFAPEDAMIVFLGP